MLGIAILTLFLGLMIPEVRQFIGLEKPRQEIAASRSVPAPQKPLNPMKTLVSEDKPPQIRKTQKSISKTITDPAVQSGKANQQAVGATGVQQGGQTQTCVGSNCVQGNNYGPQVINHFGPSLLTMNDVQQAAIRDAMKPFAGITVTIACDQVTKDSREYAEKLAKALTDAGLTVNGPANTILFWSGAPPSGPSVQVGEDRLAAATALGTAMRDSHLTESPPSRQQAS